MNKERILGRGLFALLLVLFLIGCRREERSSLLTFVATFTPTPAETATPMPSATPTLIPTAIATATPEVLEIETTPTAGEQAFIDAVDAFANSEVGEWILSDVENPQEVSVDAIVGIARNILVEVYTQLQEQGALPEYMPTLEEASEIVNSPEKALAFGSCFNPAVKAYQEDQNVTTLGEQLAYCLENIEEYESNLDIRRTVTDFIVNQIAPEE